MVVLLSEKAYSVGEIARHVPGWGKTGRITPKGVHGWIRNGVLALNGQRVRLAATRIGGRFFVSQTQIDDFLREIGHKPDVDVPAGPSMQASDAGQAENEADVTVTSAGK